jgi:DNA-binding MarR family transcriptional regulator
MTYAKDMTSGNSADRTSAAVEADEELVSDLRIAVMRLARRLRHERAGDDLTLTQLAALGTLHRCGPQTIGELAQNEHVKPPSMTRTVNWLEELGLVSREAHESDGRQVVVALTAKAEAVIAEDRRRRDAWLKTRLAELPEAQRRLLGKAAPLLDWVAQQ